MNLGKTLFAQIMRFVPWKYFERTVAHYGGNKHVRTLDCADVFRAMAFAQLTWRESLRDIETCLGFSRRNLFHMGFKGVPARSTLSDALNTRDWQIYRDLAMHLMARARKLYAAEPLNIDLDATVYALDSTTIDLCMSLFDWALFRTTKSAVKMHVLLDLRGNIPAFIHISNGKMADVKVIDILPIEAGTFYIMDRAYLDFERLYKFHYSGAFFVTRLKKTTQVRRIYSHPVDRSTRIVCDQTIALTTHALARYPERLRRIRFKDPISGKTLIFLTNNTELPALMIAQLYKNRWQVELFFKWIKQHLRVKRFFGTTENAVKIQLWSAIATYSLVAIAKKELLIEASLYTLLQILSTSIFERIELSCALQSDGYKNEPTLQNNQLNLL